MSATISFSCPKCKAQLRGPAEMAGKKARCKRCGHTFVLQDSGTPSRAAPPKAGTPDAKNKPSAPAGKKTPSKSPAASSKPAPRPKRPEESDHGPKVYGWLSEEEGVARATANPDDKETKEGFKYHEADNNPYRVSELDLTPRCPFCAKEMESEEAIICLHCGYNTQTRQHGATVRTYANTGGDQFKWMLPGIACVVVIIAMIGAICYLWLGLPNPEKVKEEWWKEFLMPAKVWGSIVAGAFIVVAGRFAVIRLILHPTPPEFEKK